jgi:hypothetical protein
VALARRDGVYTIAQAVGVSYETLARRVSEASRDEPAQAAEAVSFVELCGAQVLGLQPAPGSGGVAAGSAPVSVPQPAPGSIVELSDREGVRMTIRLGIGERLDIAALVCGFCSHRA